MREKTIRQLIKILEETGIDEIEVRRWWGVRVRVAKNGSRTSFNTHGPNGGVTGDILPKTDTESVREHEQEHSVVFSQMVGTFYRAPAPDESAFVSVGDTVIPGQTLCIIEAMKVMNEIESEVNGTVVKVLVENALPVEYNQPLFYIDERK